MDNIATKKLNEIKRISFNDIYKQQEGTVLISNEDSKLIYKNDKIFQEDGKKLKDLLRVIKIIDPLNLKYENTNILVPRVLAESNNPIPQHISVQCLFFHKLESFNFQKLKEIVMNCKYQKTLYDNMWIGFEKKLTTIKEDEILYIMNRRVGGWDGSIDRPVIELLCSGGHLPTVWDEKTQSFKTLAYEELLLKEINEELGITIDSNQITRLGGFHNEMTNELVVLCALFVNFNQLIDIINYSKNNYEENIDGIYIGVFDDVMKLYDINPDFFAGGTKAKLSNFPSQDKLMKKIRKFI